MVYIPGFLVNKVYDSGSLCNTEDGFEFCFVNTMTPLKISGMRDIRLNVDGIDYPAEKIRLILDDRPLGLGNTELVEPVTFSNNSRLTIRVFGSKLSKGKHTIRISFITNEYGGATLKVSDTLGKKRRVPPFWARVKKTVGSSRVMNSKQLSIEGELGGVPLDPDFSRLEAALQKEEPDRVPLFEAEIALPIQEWFLGREINNLEDEVEFYVRAGYDFVPVFPPYFAPRFMKSSSVEGGSSSEGERERSWLVESEGIIKTVKDVENFPWPDVEDIDYSSFYEIAPLLPPKMKTLGMLSPAAIFGNASQSMGLQNFCYALYDNPKVVEALFEIIGTAYVEIAKKMVKMPRLGACFMSDDLAYTEGLIVSPKVYRKYVFPWYKRIGEILDNAGIPFIFHSDGKLWDVLDDLADCGVKGLHPIEPQAMDIVEIKRNYGDKFCVLGNIDLDYTLTRGTIEEVEALVKKRIKDLAPGGGYCIAASNSIPDYVKPENYQAMVNAAKKFGKYTGSGFFE